MRPHALWRSDFMTSLSTARSLDRQLALASASLGIACPSEAFASSGLLRGRRLPTRSGGARPRPSRGPLPQDVFASQAYGLAPQEPQTEEEPRLTHERRRSPEEKPRDDTAERATTPSSSPAGYTRSSTQNPIVIHKSTLPRTGTKKKRFTLDSGYSRAQATAMAAMAAAGPNTRS